MTTKESVPERGSAVLICTFYNEDLEPVVPTSAKWSLSTAKGVVVNNCYQRIIEIDPITGKGICAMNNRDLSVVPLGKERVVTVEAIYNSIYGTGRSLKKEYRFDVTNLVLIGEPDISPSTSPSTSFSPSASISQSASLSASVSPSSSVSPSPGI